MIVKVCKGLLEQTRLKRTNNKGWKSHKHLLQIPPTPGCQSSLLAILLVYRGSPNKGKHELLEYSIQQPRQSRTEFGIAITNNASHNPKRSIHPVEMTPYHSERLLLDKSLRTVKVVPNTTAASEPP